MVYEPRNYSTTYPTPLGVYVNKVLSLANSGMYPDWHADIEVLSPKGKKKIYDVLMGEITELRKSRNRLRRDLVQRVKPHDKVQVKTLEDEIRWYDERVAYRQRGIEYLKSFQDFLLLLSKVK